MVRTVVGDEVQLNSTETQLSQSGIPVEVGLAIGKLGGAKSNRDSIFALIPTPPNDGTDPALLTSENVEAKHGRGDKKKGSKGKSIPDLSSLFIDVDWVAEHARQVSKMLVGGLHLVGIYVWVGEACFKNSTLMLWQAVKAVGTATPVFANGEQDERLLIHISYNPRRWSCRSCNLDANFTSMSLRPCDLKMAKVLSTLQCFSSLYNFEVRLPVLQEDGQKANSMRKILLKAILCQSEQLKCAKALLDGSLITEDKGAIAAGPHEIEFLLPFANDSLVQGNISEEVVGLVFFSGTIYARAYTFLREPLSQAIADLKGDIISSLKSRLEILYDDAEQTSESTNLAEKSAHEDASLLKPEHPLFSCNWSEPCNLIFPRRVLAPWLDGIFICDYLQPTETIQDLAEHCEELMSMKTPLDPSTVLEPEAPGATSIGTSFWGMVFGNSTSTTCTEGREDSRGPGQDATTSLSKPRLTESGNLQFIIIIGGALLAMLIALITSVFHHLRTERH